MWTLSTIRPQNKNIYNTINTDNTNNIISNDNTGYSCPCGSGKNIKNSRACVSAIFD